MTFPLFPGIQHFLDDDPFRGNGIPGFGSSVRKHRDIIIGRLHFK